MLLVLVRLPVLCYNGCMERGVEVVIAFLDDFDGLHSWLIFEPTAKWIGAYTCVDNLVFTYVVVKR